MGLRKSVFAGSWYPAGAKECEQEIQAYLAEAPRNMAADRRFIGGIVPHAGWFYSGSIACNVIHELAKGESPDVIALFGMHLHPGAPRYIMAAGAWQTPLGDIEIESVVAEALLERFDFEVEDHRHFTRDNTIELQLPFVKRFFPAARLLPIGVPPHPDSIAIGQAVAELAAERNLRLKVIGSTDLTHYGTNYGFTGHGSGSAAVDWVKNANDRRIIDAMLAMAPEAVIEEALASQNACCAGAAATALAAARQMGAARAETLAYASSYDKSPGDSFVGYVGIVFE
jgi:AmmeMemoRadiSam system protein B